MFHLGIRNIARGKYYNQYDLNMCIDLIFYIHLQNSDYSEPGKE